MREVDMTIRPFNISEDLAQMCSWYKARGNEQECPKAGDLPSIGLIVDNAAAGFLFVTEGRQLGFLEGFVTSPDIAYSDRQYALDLVTAGLIEEARDLGIGKLLSFTTSDAIYKRSLNNGFHYIGEFHCLIKGLKD